LEVRFLQLKAFLDEARVVATADSRDVLYQPLRDAAWREPRRQGGHVYGKGQVHRPQDRAQPGRDVLFQLPLAGKLPLRNAHDGRASGQNRKELRLNRTEEHV